MLKTERDAQKLCWPKSTYYNKLSQQAKQIVTMVPCRIQHTEMQKLYIR